MKTCERGIYELLKVYASGRVYAQRAPQNATAPFIIFQRVSSERWRSINNPSGIAQASIQIDVYGADYYQAKDLAATIEAALDGYTGVVSYGASSPQETLAFLGISLQNDVDIFDQTDEPFLYRNSAVYLVTYDQGD